MIDPIAKVTQVATDTKVTLYNGITTEELDLATINAAVQNIKENPDYDDGSRRPGQRERPRAIPGAPPNLMRLPAGCSFAARCPVVHEVCLEQMPPSVLVGGNHSARCWDLQA